MTTKAPRLVFGDDGSAASDVTWAWVGAHSWPGWRISVVTARPTATPVSRELAEPHPWDPPVRRELPPGGGLNEVEHLVAEADPRLVLDSFTDAALLAVGPRGQGLLKRLHLGSTAEWLVSGHRPLVPVVVVRSPRPTRNVLLCVDGSAHAQRAAQTLRDLPWIGSCRITILGVVGLDPDVERGSARAAELLADCDPTVVLTDPSKDLASYEVRAVILRTIDRERPDLVAVGTRGIGGLPRMVLGSTASAVVHHAECSVLVAPAAEAAS